MEKFAEFIFSKNATVEILHRKTNFETFKYFRNNNQIRKVLFRKTAGNVDKQ